MPPKDYQPPTLTIDCVLFKIVDGQLVVLIGKVAGPLYHGEWALPGGFCAKGETTQQALDRIMLAKAGIDVRRLGLVEQLHTFDNIAGDGRGHAVDVVFMGIGYDTELGIENKESVPYFAHVKDLPPLGYDQREFVDFAVARLRSLLRDTNVAAAFLPKLFLLSSLQKVYEAILGRPLDKRNFRKRILAYDMLDVTDQWKTDGAHPKARYYKFKTAELQQLHRDF